MIKQVHWVFYSLFPYCNALFQLNSLMIALFGSMCDQSCFHTSGRLIDDTGRSIKHVLPIIAWANFGSFNCAIKWKQCKKQTQTATKSGTADNMLD